MQYDYFERTGEMHFTPPVQTIYAAQQALIEYWNEGEIKKWKRHQRIMKAIHDGEERLGFKEVLPREVQSGLVSAVRYPDDENWNFDKVHDYCYERGFTIYPGKIERQGTFRLCALGAIDESDIFEFWRVFEDALKFYKIQIPVLYR
jgi:2-aminoethylphosphonate-pyruvate transaminase